jgi:ABC-type transporter Mla subunit MlaD
VKRILLTAFVTAAVLVGAVVLAGAGDEGGRKFTVELDNAFGLIEGADVKVAGVRAGKIQSLEVDEKSYRALVGIEITATGYGDLRKDVFCESRPQSLIGEYFLDCLPGKASEKLEEGARIPVERTGSTVPADLVNNIMRRPTRERLSILLGELGAALAARGEDLNETIRRASPALRETDKVLAELARERKTIRNLTATAEDVVTRLADNRKDVTRFVREARDTAAVSAVRQAELRAQFQRFPTFLRELRPTMKLLGEAADHQRPAFAVLSSQAGRLTEFLDTLGPFSQASRPATRTLAAAARAGRPAVRAGRPRIRELKDFAEELPELSGNLAVTLEHLHDRDFAVEKDARAPGGKGFTGFEALLQYIFRQDMATNVYDSNSYLLKVSAFLDYTCANYADVAAAKDPAKQYCRATLGPSQPGIDQPDPTATTQTKRARRRARREAERTPAAADPVTQLPQVQAPDAPLIPGGNVVTDALELAKQQTQPLLDFLLRP